MHRMFWIAPLALAAMVLFAFIGGIVVMALWNWLLPTLFGIHVITFWQALGILILARILFGGFGPGARGGSGMGNRMRERMRERMRQRVHENFGVEPPSGESTAL